ncbi:helix-turn-helix domain-containing protein, partial [Streptomyces sp. A73]|nr:helix-turn-helix domain-containing protein [Streptomyces sp. A73]
QDLKRLGKHVERRRIELYPSRKAAADTVGMSKDTWRKIERGETVRAGSYAKVESALHWAPGSCQDILDGGKPVPVEPL